MPCSNRFIFRRIFCSLSLAGLMMACISSIGILYAQPKDSTTKNTSFSKSKPNNDDDPRKVVILKHKGFVDIVRLNELNSNFVEGNPFISPDGKTLFFLTERGGMPWSRKKTLMGYENYEGFDGDIWYAERASNGGWKAPEPLGESINSERGEDEPCISFDGHTVLFESWRDGWRDNGGPYYAATFQGITWTNPVGLGGGLNEFFYAMRYKDSTYATDGSTFSTDMKTTIFASGPRYDAPMDLFISKKDAGGKWSYPKKLILPVDGDERSAFLAADGKTLYFSTNAFDGFGGLDIYKATLKPDGSVTSIVNIGEAFNTKGDDYGFTLTATGDEAFFVRNGDLYTARLGKNMDALKPAPTAVLTGVVKHKDTGVPMGATVELRELPKGEPMRCIANPLTGEYAAVLTIGKSYEQTATAPDVTPFKRIIKVQPTKQGGSLKLEYDIILAPPRKTW
jgi:hypothetical protein